VEKKKILLDMDGVLSDFLSGAIKVLNKKFNKTITLEQYVKEFGCWETYDYFGITPKEFWDAIGEEEHFWLNLKPIPWAKDLYKALDQIGEVTIVTSPSLDPQCIVEKYQWLSKYLGVGTDKVFMGTRKYLLAGNGILIDDYFKNVESFKEAGGKAILVPSVWNTSNLTFELVVDTINTQFFLWKQI
jgi:5'(3')-deoxyribonucleotidase